MPLSCRDGYCTYGNHCRYCGQIIERPEMTEMKGLHSQAYCDECWSSAVRWFLHGTPVNQIAKELRVGVSTVQSYLARRHLVPEENYRKTTRKATAKQGEKPIAKDAVKAYQKTGRYKASQQAYHQTEEYKDYQRNWQQNNRDRMHANGSRYYYKNLEANRKRKREATRRYRLKKKQEKEFTNV